MIYDRMYNSIHIHSIGNFNYIMFILKMKKLEKTKEKKKYLRTSIIKIDKRILSQGKNSHSLEPNKRVKSQSPARNLTLNFKVNELQWKSLSHQMLCLCTVLPAISGFELRLSFYF